MEVEISKILMQETPVWQLMRALLLHHYCWYNRLPCQYKLTPPFVCVLQPLCGFQFSP